jgi:hypothetical protein
MDILRSSASKERRISKILPRNYYGSQTRMPARTDYFYHRKLIYLKNQKRLMLRFLHEGDRRDLISLFQSAPDEDFRFCKHDLKDLALLNQWLDHINSPRLFPLVAVDLDDTQLIAAASLLRDQDLHCQALPQLGSGLKNVR